MAKGNPQAYKNSEFYKQKQEDMNNVGNGDNRRYLAHELEVMRKGRDERVDTSDPKAVQDRIDWYFNLCLDHDMKPTVTGLCSSLHIHKDTVRSWYHGTTRGGTHTDLIKDAYTTLETLWEDYMSNGKINPASGIFLGRNHWGYQDQVAVVVKEPEPLGPAPDAAQLAATYIEALPETHTTYKELDESAENP